MRLLFGWWSSIYGHHLQGVLEYNRCCEIPPRKLVRIRIPDRQVVSSARGMPHFQRRQRTAPATYDDAPARYACRECGRGIVKRPDPRKRLGCPVRQRILFNPPSGGIAPNPGRQSEEPAVYRNHPQTRLSLYCPGRTRRAPGRTQAGSAPLRKSE